MELNLNCLKDLLLTVEKLSTPSNPVTFIDKSYLGYQFDDAYQNIEPLSMYDWDTLLSTAELAENAGLLLKGKASPPKGYELGQLTMDGYDFIKSINNDTKFNKLKNFVAKHALQGIPTLLEIVQLYLNSASR